MPDSSDNVNSGARASAVDWSRPIEAVHEDGRVERVERDYSQGPDPDFYTTPPSDNPVGQCHGIWTPAGASWCNIHPGWRIRNVQPTTPELDPALWDRMVALCQKIATWAEERTPAEPLHVSAAEASAIVADLPKPVDPDLIEARECAAQFQVVSIGKVTRAGDMDNQPIVRAALAAIKRGRELAAPEVSHVG